MMTLHQLKQVSSPFDFNRDWDEIIEMFHDAKERRDWWFRTLQKLKESQVSIRDKRFTEAVRNYNALQGVVKTLNWVLSTQAPDPLD